MMLKRLCLGFVALLLCASPAFGHIFSNTFVELHADFGKTNEFYNQYKSAGRFTMTLEHYSAFAYGDNFFFIDADSGRNFQFSTNDGGLYLEYAPRFSFNRIFGFGKWEGLLSEVYFTPQVNYGFGSFKWGPTNGNVAHFGIGPVWLFGISVDINIPGIQVLNFSVLYRYEFRTGPDPIDGTYVPDDSGIQLTLVWAAKLGQLFEVKKKSDDPEKEPELSRAGELWTRGFFDYWNRGAITNDRSTFLTEPQIYLYLLNDVAIGTEIEMSYNFSGSGRGVRFFEVDPTIFVRWDF